MKTETKIISVVNQKGGVGKTTTAWNVGIGLVKSGYKVLLLDFDPQGDLTTCLGWKNNEELENTVSSLLLNKINNRESNMDDFILHNDEGVDLIPSNPELLIGFVMKLFIQTVPIIFHLNINKMVFCKLI